MLSISVSVIMVVVGRMQEGQYTQTIYTYIKQGQYVEAIDCLLPEYENNNNSRAALSLLGYCYYQIGDFISAADCYGQLIQVLGVLDSGNYYLGLLP